MMIKLHANVFEEIKNRLKDPDFNQGKLMNLLFIFKNLNHCVLKSNKFVDVYISPL